MTFLDGVIRFCDECGVNANSLTTVVGQTGQLKRMVNWYASAWISIQAKRDDWKFMRLTATWPLIAGTSSYLPTACAIAAGTFRDWIPENGRTFFTIPGLVSEQHLDYRSYESFRNLWLFGANRTVSSRPIEVTTGPDDALIVGPSPISGLEASMDYYRNAVLLTADANVPAMPLGHDDIIIVHKAMLDYGGFYAAREVYARAQKAWKEEYRNLVNDQTPSAALVGAFR